MSVVGFDFGNDCCVVAIAHKRVIETVQNAHGNRKTPTFVAFSGKQRLMGEDASAQASSNAKNTFTFFKRLLGIRYDSPELKTEQTHINYPVNATTKGTVAIPCDYNDEKQVMSVEQITTAMMTKLKQIAEQKINIAVTDCVIGCPPYWTDAQRRALLDAANGAGLNVLRLMNETTAVALNYGLLRPLPENQTLKVMFIDVGATSTNVALVSFNSNKLKVLSCCSDRHLGGRDFDRMLVDWIAAKVRKQYNMDPLSQPKPTQKLFASAARIKTTLSANSVVPYTIEYLMNDVDVKGQIERHEFEALAEQAGLLKRLTIPVQQALDQAGTKKEELFAVELVGGAHRIPIGQKTLQDFLGREVSKTCDADESVARGCVLMCAMLSPNFLVKQFDVQDITPYSIDLGWGIAPRAGKDAVLEDNATLFKAGNSLPSVKLISFKDRNEPFQLVARYTNPELLPPGTDPLIGRFIVSGMPSDPISDKTPKIKVKVKLDLHGVVTVSSAQMLKEIKHEEPAASAAPAAAAAAGAAAPAADPADVPMGDKEKPAEPAPMEAEQGDGKDKADAAAENDAKKDDKDDDAMDEEDAKGKSSSGKKKTVTQRIPLTLQSHTASMTKEDFDALYERETRMNSQDKAIAETDMRRNELESYVLDMRNKITDSLKDFISDAERAQFSELLQTTETWLYDEGFDAQKSEFIKRLEELRKVGEPCVRRKIENESRGHHAGLLKTAIAKFSVAAQSSEEKYAHIPAEDKEKVVKFCSSLDQWLANSLIHCDHVNKAENPPVTCADFDKKREELDAFCTPLLNKPKPKPEPPKPAADAKAPEPAAASAGPKMETEADGSASPNPAAGAAGAAKPAADDTPMSDAGGAASPQMDVEKP